MALLGFELEEIARVIEILEKRELDELIFEADGRSLRLRGPRRERPAVSLAPTSHPQVPAAGPAPTTPPRRHAASRSHSISSNGAASADALPADQIALTAPMVGVFYRSDRPGGPPFVNVGERVAVGQTIGLIEAMKVFSEVPAEHAGIVVAIPAQDGQLVQAGTPLMILQRE
ncbi:MAG: biotin/lipoyl-containing protein [Chloroherpetonaceae bacterium]|nr:hypothetical protein [Chthonomonadaceae bacterium]MDW8209137.1 biotin/lipoyl-containing protein [Chloroherpetonaceae bacterium]